MKWEENTKAGQIPWRTTHMVYGGSKEEVVVFLSTQHVRCDTQNKLQGAH
jgi:hypothetical protein